MKHPKTRTRNMKFFLTTGFFLAIMLPASVSCKKKSDNHLFTLLPSSVTGADFVNELDYNKQLRTKFNIYTFRNFYNGAGVGLSDFNNDGLTDIFMTSNMGK